MAAENKGPILAVMGALIGMIVIGSINSDYTVLGAITGAVIGYIFGSRT